LFFFILLQVSVFTGLDNELFYMDKTMMVFGDVKKVIEDMVKAVE
jgi:NAD/NADP transhydrogenase beta subunit